VVVIKSVEQPDNLTAEDIYTLNLWLINIMSIYASGHEANEMGIPSAYSSFTEPYAAYLFASRYSRHWFERNKFWLGTQHAETIARVIESTPVATKWQRFEEYYSQP